MTWLYYIQVTTAIAIHLGSTIPHCLIRTKGYRAVILWFVAQETNSDAKLSEISAALSVPVQLLCNCSLSVQRRFFSCLGTTDSQTVVFLAELSYTVHPSVDMPSFLTSWVTSTPHIIVASAQLQVDSTCPMVIDSMEPESCAVAQLTDMPFGIIATVVACVIALLVVAITVAIVVAVVVCCRKQSKRR